ncbi:MAG: hypothetical protein ABI361_07590 [Nitrososphaera sp.]|jgi:mannose-6-phosphate isomerase-like protein (cupin superfamily)
MSLKPNEDIGMAIHHENDQFIRVEQGQGKAIIDGSVSVIVEDSAVVIPGGSAQYNQYIKPRTEAIHNLLATTSSGQDSTQDKGGC